MLQHLHVAQLLEEADLAQRPHLGVAAEEQEGGEPEEHQRPVPRPARTRPGAAARAGRCDTNSPTSGGCIPTRRCPRRCAAGFAGAGDEGRAGRAGLGGRLPRPASPARRAGSELSWSGTARRGHARRVALGDLRPGHAVLGEVDGRGEREVEGGGGEEEGEADADLRPRQSGAGGRPRARCGHAPCRATKASCRSRAEQGERTSPSWRRPSRRRRCRRSPGGRRYRDAEQRHPEARMQATPSMEMSENRSPTTRHAGALVAPGPGPRRRRECRRPRSRRPANAAR